MSEAKDTHPSQEELAAFSSGRLNVVESDEVEKHLSECETCCETLKNLPDDDTLVSLLRPETDTSTSDDVSAASSEHAITLAVPVDDATAPPAAATTDVAGPAAGVSHDLPDELLEHPRYRIVELLGRGGMGDVYRAEHKVMSRPVALKVIKPQLVQNDAAVRRFQREVRAAARLHHPNIVTAYDAEQAGDLHYLVMEYVDGVDLDKVINQRGPIPVLETCEYIRQTAEGLQHAHELGMVHRDIKPHNLMIFRDQRTEIRDQESVQSTIAKRQSAIVKILDFGLANFASETAAEEIEEAHPEKPAAAVEVLNQLTQVGTMMGTPDYIAPEQAKDAHTADIRADIYSLGCTFYTLLTGRAPFSEGSVMDKIKAHNEQDAAPLSDYRDDVPVEVEQILQRMMAKDAADRYQTPGEVVVAIESFARKSSQPLETRTLQVTSQTRRPRQPIVIFTAATCLLIALIAAAVVYYVQTDYGVVRVEVADESLNVSFSGNTITMKDGNKQLSIRTGEQNLVVRRGDFEFETESFQLRRGDQVALKIELFEGQVVVTKNGRRFGTKLLHGGIVGEGSDAEEIALIRKLEGHTGPVKQVAFSPDGTLAASASGWPEGDRTVRIWEVATGKELHELVGHTNVVLSVAFTSDGKQVVSGGWDRTLRFWDVATGEQTQMIRGPNGIHEFALHPEGNTVLVVYSGRIALQERNDEQTNRWTVRTNERVLAVKICPDGKRFITGDDKGRVVVWDLSNGQPLKTYDLMPSTIEDLDISPDGKTALVAGQAKGLLHFEIDSGKVFQQLSVDNGKCVRFSRDGRLAAGGGPGSVSVFDLSTGKMIATTDNSDDGYGFWSVCFSPDSHQLLAGGGSIFDTNENSFVKQGDYALRLWRLPESVWPTTNEMTEDDLNSLIVEAAGIPNDEWTQLGTDPAGPNAKHVTGTPLSWLLLTLNPNDLPKDAADVRKDFRILKPNFPKPSELSGVMWISIGRGYASIIQPEYITRTSITTEGETARGTVEFEAKGMYAGSVEFAARHVRDKWQIDEFQLPNYGISIRLEADGKWQRIER